MATFTKVPHSDGTTHFKARIRHAGKQKSKTFSTISDAKKWAKRMEVDIERLGSGLISAGNGKTLAEAIRRYCNEVLPEKSPTTARPYRIHLRFWEKELGHSYLSAITGEQISAIRDTLRSEGRAPATVNRYLASLASVLTASIKRWHWLTVSPMLQVDKPAENNQRRRFLSKEELGRLLTACKESESPDLYTAVMLAITTGARQNEILGMRWKEVNLQRQVITLANTKNGDGRVLPIVAQVVPLLKARQADKTGPLVFPSKVSRANPIRLHRSFNTALKRAGIDNFHWHDLRHSCASFLAGNGATLLEIGEVLGHRSMNTTKRYAHLTERHSHNLVRGLADDLLGGVNEDV